MLGASPREVEAMQEKMKPLAWSRVVLPVLSTDPNRNNALMITNMVVNYSSPPDNAGAHMLDVGHVGWKLRMNFKNIQSADAQRVLSELPRFQIPLTMLATGPDEMFWKHGDTAFRTAAELGGVRLAYKVGQAAAGKDVTIYVGFRDHAVKLAKILEDYAGPILKVPTASGAASKTDVPMTKKGLISGRFAAYGAKIISAGKPRTFKNYGFKGFPSAHDGGDWEEEEEDPIHFAKSYSLWCSLFGRAFVGEKHPFIPEPPKGADSASVL